MIFVYRGQCISLSDIPVTETETHTEMIASPKDIVILAIMNLFLRIVSIRTTSLMTLTPSNLYRFSKILSLPKITKIQL